MRILHVITSLLTGGAEKLLVDLLPLISDRGHDVELCVFDGVDTPFKRNLGAMGITILELGNNRSVYHPVNLFKLFKLIHQGGYDIIHTHNTAPQLFAAITSLYSDAKFVTTEHNTSNRRRRWRWYAPVDRWMYNRYRRVICISQKAEDNLREYLGHCNAQIGTINNGIDIARYTEASSSSDLELIAPGSRKIIMVAGFRPQKDQDTIISALKYLPAEFHLFLVGDGVRRPELEALCTSVEATDRVHFLGIRTDVPQLLHAADYVVMSSHYEGLSLSSIEGMSVGKPFLASDVDGLREVVAGAGILFPHEDQQALAREILNLENNIDLYHDVAQSCCKRAKEYDISKMADGYAALYASL